MKKILILIIISALSCSAWAQKSRIDSMAVYLLQRSSINLQYLDACSFTSQVTYDVWTEDLGLVKHSYTDDVSIQFPDKMAVRSEGDKGRKQMVYDGKKFCIYSYNNNTYVQIDAPASVIEMIYMVSSYYGIEFSAADFFYPTFVDDILATSGHLYYLGLTQIDNKWCHHIAGTDMSGSNFQFWISDDQHFLPIKMVIVYGKEKGSPQYEAVYKNWVLNPVLSFTLFEFTPPPQASITKLTPLSK